jgi:hypothetical protein
MENQKAKPLASDDSIFVVSGCCADVLKTKEKEDYPSIDLTEEGIKNPIQEIPAGIAKCDWCGKDNDVPSVKIRIQG